MRWSSPWIATAAVAFQCATLAAGPVAAQQRAAMEVSAQVVAMSMPLTPEVMTTLLDQLRSNPPAPQGSRSRASAGRSGAAMMRSGFSEARATRECPEGGTGECRLVVTVQFLSN